MDHSTVRTASLVQSLRDELEEAKESHANAISELSKARLTLREQEGAHNHRVEMLEMELEAAAQSEESMTKETSAVGER